MLQLICNVPAVVVFFFFFFFMSDALHCLELALLCHRLVNAFLKVERNKVLLVPSI